jgi:HlyD family secretion protein
MNLRNSTSMAADTQSEGRQSLHIDGLAWTAGESQGARLRRYIIATAAVAVIVAVPFTYGFLHPNIPMVTVTKAVMESNPPNDIDLTARGYVVPHHRINVNPKVTGRVAWIGVERGEKVRQGQILVRLEDDEFRALYEQALGAVDSARAYLDELEHGPRPAEIHQAEHNLDEARVVLREDKLTLDRTRELAAQGVVSPQALDDATARYDADQQRVRALENGLQLAKSGPRPEEIERAQGNLAEAEGQQAYAKSMLDATVIRAPVGGTILERTAEKGELVTAQFASGAEGGPQGEVVALANLHDVQVELNIPQSAFARLSLNQKALVRLDAFPEREYKGVMAEVAPEADRQEGTIQVRVQILNPDKYLRPEMNATVQFLAGKRKTRVASPAGIFVPSAAIYDEGGRHYVLAVSQGRVIRRNFEVVAPHGGGFLVQGLTPGEEIIVSGRAGLTEGTKVKLKDPGEF